MAGNSSSEDKMLTLTKDIVNVTSGAASISSVNVVLNGFGITREDLEQSIVVLTQVIELIRGLPAKFFKSVDDRNRALSAFQDVLDEQILKEEELSQEVVNGEE